MLHRTYVANSGIPNQNLKHKHKHKHTVINTLLINDPDLLSARGRVSAANAHDGKRGMAPSNLMRTNTMNRNFINCVYLFFADLFNDDALLKLRLERHTLKVKNGKSEERVCVFQDTKCYCMMWNIHFPKTKHIHCFRVTHMMSNILQIPCMYSAHLFLRYHHEMKDLHVNCDVRQHQTFTTSTHRNRLRAYKFFERHYASQAFRLARTYPYPYRNFEVTQLISKLPLFCLNIAFNGCH